MKLYPNQLTTHLSKSLLPLYLISGDEPLLVLEAVDAIRHAASQQGFTERHRFQLDRTFDPEQLSLQSHNLSLFADKQIFELHSVDKVHEKLPSLITELCDAPSADRITIISTPKLTPAQSKAKWVQQLDKAGAQIAVWPLDAKDYPNWLQQRARQYKLSLTPDALSLLAHQTEGNLLAAIQMLQKLSIEYAGQSVSASQLTEVLSDQSHFDVFHLASAVLQGDVARSRHILDRLFTEGTEPTIIIWALSKEIRLITTLHEQSATPLAQLFKQHRIWPKRQPEIQTALRQYSYETCLQKLCDLAYIDQQLKGIRHGDALESLKQWILV